MNDSNENAMNNGWGGFCLCGNVWCDTVNIIGRCVLLVHIRQSDACRFVKDGKNFLRSINKGIAYE